VKPIAAIAHIAAALERGDDLEPVCREVVAAVTSKPNAPYIAPVAESVEDGTTAEEINAARASRGQESL
jgi:hypothetical protein